MAGKQQLKYELDRRVFKHPYKIASEVIDYLDPTRYVLHERFNRKPNLNADLASGTEATREPSNPDFEILGTNCVSTCSAFAAAGGVTLTTTTASGDQVILTPHLDTAQSAWAATAWATDKQATFETVIVTGASVASAVIWAGFKLTNTSVIATDDNQCMFRYAAATNGGAWTIVNSRAGTDVETVVPVASVAAPVASTKYRLRIAIGSTRQPRFWINDKEVFISAGNVFPALTDAVTLIPYIGVQTATTAAKAIDVRGLICSRV